MMDDPNNISKADNQTPMHWIPQIGMKFDSIDDAWNFWVEYGGKMGFNVRKHYANKNKRGDVTSRRFVCAKEGRRKQDKRDHTVTRTRAETRTGCKVRLGIYLNQSKKYEVHDFVYEHNHPLHLPETSHLLSSQRKINEVQGAEIEAADNCGITPKQAHGLMGAHVGGTTNLGFTRRDHRNYLRSKRQRDLMYGEAGSLLRYFHLQTVENPSFQYSIQLDSDEQITNIFWADARMLIDYASFGDVVAFDTTFGTNKESRPLGVFVGFNHFRELVVFGAALLYDETAESFKWLFETFLATHDNVQPKTIFTDQDIAMGKAIAEVMPNTWHGLCTWHIMQNATKHLIHCGADILQDFRACMYDYYEEATFEKAFDALRERVKQVFDALEGEVKRSTWLDSIYALKKKWAECYMSNVRSLGMRSTQLSESFNKDLKDYLRCNMDIVRFFKHFERVVDEKRENEVNAEFDSREKLPRLKMHRTPLLRQASQIYTPQVFEAFQDEYEWSTAAYIKPPVEGQPINVYRVAISSLDIENVADTEYKVLGDPSTETVSCSCKMFERLGVLCSHALKVLDLLNIKLLPQKYILKRWTREARIGHMQDMSGRTVVEDPKLDITRRYRGLCRKLVKIASRAATFEKSSLLLDERLDNVSIEVDKLLMSMTIEEGKSSMLVDLNANVQQNEVGVEVYCSNNITLKKKVVRPGGKRKKSWIEKFHKENRKKATRQSQEHQHGEVNNRRKKRQNYMNKENQPPKPQRGENQQPKASTNILHQSACGSSSYTQLLLGEWDGSETPGSCSLNDDPILTQDQLTQRLPNEMPSDWLGL